MGSNIQKILVCFQNMYYLFGFFSGHLHKRKNNYISILFVCPSTFGIQRQIIGASNQDFIDIELVLLPLTGYFPIQCCNLLSNYYTEPNHLLKNYFTSNWSLFGLPFPWIIVVFKRPSMLIIFIVACHNIYVSKLIIFDNKIKAILKPY